MYGSSEINTKLIARRIDLRLDIAPICFCTSTMHKNATEYVG
jgi:hypothetical protein